MTKASPVAKPGKSAKPLHPRTLRAMWRRRFELQAHRRGGLVYVHSLDLKESAAEGARLRAAAELALTIAKPLITEKGRSWYELAELMGEFWAQNAGWPRVDLLQIFRIPASWNVDPVNRSRVAKRAASPVCGPGATWGIFRRGTRRTRCVCANPEQKPTTVEIHIGKSVASAALVATPQTSCTLAVITSLKARAWPSPKVGQTGHASSSHVGFRSFRDSLQANGLAQTGGVLAFEAKTRKYELPVRCPMPEPRFRRTPPNEQA